MVVLHLWQARIDRTEPSSYQSHCLTGDPKDPKECNKQAQDARVTPKLHAADNRLRIGQLRKGAHDLVRFLRRNHLSTSYAGDFLEHIRTRCTADWLGGGSLNKERCIERRAGLLAGEGHLVLARLLRSVSAAECSP